MWHCTCPTFIISCHIKIGSRLSEIKQAKVAEVYNASGRVSDLCNLINVYFAPSGRIWHAGHSAFWCFGILSNFCSAFRAVGIPVPTLQGTLKLALGDTNNRLPNPIQSNVNKRAQVFLFARILYNITFTYKLKHLRFQWTRNKNCKEHLDQASVCLDDFWKY